MCTSSHPPRAAILLVAALVVAAGATIGRAQTVVEPKAETAPVPSSGDAADDSAVWVHPTHRGLSLVIGTDKQSGLAVYDLAGNQRQFLPDGSMNNVDLRYGFPLGGSREAIVASGERNGNVLAIYVVDPATRTLRPAAARTISLGIDVYGCCLYRSPVTGEFYFFATSEDGEVQQWRLFDNGAGRVDAVLARTLDVGGQSEGCVADDENGWLFVAEEEAGIWRYGAEPGDGVARVTVDVEGPGGHLVADVEGLGLFYAPGGGGYLIASSQGNSSFVVYQRRAPHAYVLTFAVGEHPALGIDAVTGTDGLEVVNVGLGAAFPSGLLVVQDDSNGTGNQNFKLVDWAEIALSVVPPLTIAPNYDALDAGRVEPPRSCAVPRVTYRFGSLPNPYLLAAANEPRLGRTWRATLDCTGHAPAKGHLFVYSAPGDGTFLASGELLVDATSTRLSLQSGPHGGGPLAFTTPLPPTLSLCGFTMTAQGLCNGAPGSALSNAIDLVLGR